MSELDSGATWEIWLSDPYGERILDLGNHATEWSVTRVANNIGAFSIKTKLSGLDNPAVLDGLVLFYRRSRGGGRPALVNVGVVRAVEWSQSSGGNTILSISGGDVIDYLSRRIVAYPAGSTQSLKSGAIDDVMKEIIDENFVNPTDTNRVLDRIASVESNLSLGGTTEIGMSYRNVLAVLQDLSDESITRTGSRIFFDLVPTIDNSGITFKFVTRGGQLGNDLTTSGAIFSVENMRLTNVSLAYDFSEERNYIYAGGPGEENERQIVEISSANRIKNSPYNRVEGFIDARNRQSTNGITTAANKETARRRPVRRFSAEVVERPGSYYGTDWEFGDRIRTEFIGIQDDSIISTVGFTVVGGHERMLVRIENTSAIAHFGRLK